MQACLGIGCRLRHLCARYWACEAEGPDAERIGTCKTLPQSRFVIFIVNVKSDELKFVEAEKREVAL